MGRTSLLTYYVYQLIVDRYTMKIRGTTTDRLADVIQSLQFIRKSGLLTVERDDPSGFSELGTILFRDGTIVDANVGRLRGPEAFSKLVTWTTCRFLFEATSRASSTTAPLSAAGHNNQGTEQKPNERLTSKSSSSLMIPYRSQHVQGI